MNYWHRRGIGWPEWIALILLLALLIGIGATLAGLAWMEFTT